MKQPPTADFMQQITESRKLESLVRTLKPDQLLQLQSDMVNVGLAYTLGGKPRELARRLGNQYLGRRKKFYTLLSEHKDLASLVKILVDHVNSDPSETTRTEELSSITKTRSCGISETICDR